MNIPSIRVALVLLISAVCGAQQLPDTATPENYQLSLAPDLQKKTFQGNETIRVRLFKPTPTVTLNAAEITFREVRIEQGGLTQTANVATDPKQETATLTVKKALAPGEATLHIVYSGILNDQMRGFYVSKTDKRNYAVTQFEATDARRAFRSFDQPDKKATFEVTAIVDQGDVAISNGRMVSDTPGPGTGKHTVSSRLRRRCRHTW